MDSTDVLVVGGGFGGAIAARELERRFRRRPHRALLASPENFLLYTPLLPEAASGVLEPRHAVVPLRRLLRRTSMLTGRVTALDPGARRAEITDIGGRAHEVAYTTAILAPGSEPATLPIPGLAEHAVGFKSLADAIWLRNRTLRQLELAEAEDDAGRRRALLTFTFVGGGYAGVEALAELRSLAYDALVSYPRLRPADMRWVLVEAQDRLLPGLDERLADYTERRLRAMGIEVLLDTTLDDYTDRVARLSTGDEYECPTLVWTAGQRPSRLLADAGFPVDDAGRVRVDTHTQVVDHPDHFALGDAAAVPDPDGNPCPPTAQHAVRQAATAARNVAAAHGIGEAEPFGYRTKGMAITLGRGDGTAQVGSRTVTGRMASLMAKAYHLYMLPTYGRRLRVTSDWALSVFFPRDVVQLGQLGEPSPLPGHE